MADTILEREEEIEVLTHAPPVTPSAVRPWHQNFAPPKDSMQVLTSYTNTVAISPLHWIK